MSDIRLIGLESIKIGNITNSKAMGAGSSINTVNAIVPDSAHLIIEPPGVTDLFIEETDVPDIQILGTSKKTIEFATRDMGTGILIEAFGGAVAGTGSDALVWNASVTAIVVQERCIEAVSKVYNGFQLKIQIPRASLRSGGDLRFTKTESGQISFALDVLMPSSSTAISPIVITQVAE